MSAQRQTREQFEAEVRRLLSVALPGDEDRLMRDYSSKIFASYGVRRVARQVAAEIVQYESGTRDLRVDASESRKQGDIEVLELEATVVDLTERLNEGIEGDASVTRDMLGTLHVNLCALERATRKAIGALEGKYGFGK